MGFNSAFKVFKLMCNVGHTVPIKYESLSVAMHLPTVYSRQSEHSEPQPTHAFSTVLPEKFPPHIGQHTVRVSQQSGRVGEHKIPSL